MVHIFLFFCKFEAKSVELIIIIELSFKNLNLNQKFFKKGPIGTPLGNQTLLTLVRLCTSSKKFNNARNRIIQSLKKTMAFYLIEIFNSFTDPRIPIEKRCNYIQRFKFLIYFSCQTRETECERSDHTPRKD